MIGVCILAYGDEWILECNGLLKQLSVFSEFKFYVTTDQPDSVLKVDNLVLIPTTEPFNYNLKRNGFRQSLLENDITIMLDTDIYIQNGFTPDLILELEDGVHVRYQKSIHGVKNLQHNIEYEYIKRIQSTSGLKDLFYLDESAMVFNISDIQKRKVILEWWDRLYNATLDVQPEYRNPGAVEGMMINVGLTMSGVDIHLKHNFSVLDYFHHYHYFLSAPNWKKEYKPIIKTII